MPKTKVIAKTCGNCGVDVRENTLFCYACGTQIGVSVSDPITKPDTELESGSNGASAEGDQEKQSALADLAARFKIDEGEGEDKLARAAAKRRKARIKQRKPVEYVWEPAGDSASGLIALVAVIVTILAGVAVFLIVLWR